MPTPMLLYVLLFVGMIAGAIQAVRLIAASRRAVPRPGALYEWQVAPLNSWKYEPTATTAILIHTLSVLALGCLALRASANPGILTIVPVLSHDATMIALVWFVQCGSMLVTGNQTGALLAAIPLITMRRKPVLAAITTEGMAYGRSLLPWRRFSRFSLDRDAGLLRLYSAFAPDLPSLTLKLPEAAPLGELADLLRGFLPDQAPETSRAWYRTKNLLVPSMLLVCLPFLAVGWLAPYLTRELALFLMALFASVLGFLGGVVINQFAFGTLVNPGNVPRQPKTAPRANQER